MDICDLLFEPNHHISADVKVILKLLSAIRKVLPGEISPLLPLPKAFAASQKEPLKMAWEKFEKIFRIQHIDAGLSALPRFPFNALPLVKTNYNGAITPG